MKGMKQMKLKDVFKAQDSLTKYIEDFLTEPITSQQAYDAMIVVSAMADRTLDPVIKASLQCIINTLWSINIDRKPEP
jgi:hypothetical protein